MTEQMVATYELTGIDLASMTEKNVVAITHGVDVIARRWEREHGRKLKLIDQRREDVDSHGGAVRETRVYEVM